MTGFNLSGWALRHQALVLFSMVIMTIAGVLSYMALGRAEDPNFTIKVMVVSAEWPGATAREMEQQVTDKIEKKLQEVPYFDFVRSYSKPGAATVFVTLKDYTPPKQVPDIWYQVRKKISDIQGSFPQGMRGPYFNDEFGDTYAGIYAFMGEDFSPAELKHVVEDARQRVLSVKDANKADLLGVQDERIWVTISHQKLATLGIPFQSVTTALQSQNGIAAAGSVDTSASRVFVRVEGKFETEDAVREVPIEAGGRTFRLGDIAEVERGYIDPPAQIMRYQGRPAIGLAVTMAKGGNALTFGEALKAEMAKVKADLPLGMEVAQVSDQATVVEHSVGEFVKSLGEALAIVLIVSFISLGLRTGIVVALSVPLVLAITMVIMFAMGIDLHRISLGALIIALGLLVDDAIIAVEMMVVKMEQGWDRVKAATYAYSSTAFPMLTGTIVTAAGFVPVGFAKSAAGEYTNSIFWVVAISLGISWIVAVVFTPYLGFHLLPKPKPHAGAAAGHASDGHDHDAALYDKPIYRRLRSVIAFCVRRRWLVIAVTLLAFVTALGSFKFVEQQFFPSSERPELLVHLRLAEGSSFQATMREAQKLEAILKDDKNVVAVTSYVGTGSPRFYLPMDQQLPNANFSELVVLTKGQEERETLIKTLQPRLEEEFPLVRARVNRLENGPPVGFPVQFRVTGPDPDMLREYAYRVRDVMRQNPNVRDVNLDWDERSKRVSLEVDQAKARALGVSTADISQALQTLLSGVTLTQYREHNQLIDVVARAPEAERVDLGRIGEINVPTSRGGSVPLAQVATVKYALEESMLWRRDRTTTITVRADVRDGIQAPVVSQQIQPTLDQVRAAMPSGYGIVMGGIIEESAKGNGSLLAMMPIMLFIMLVALMVQLQSFQRVLMVFLTAPLGLIGVTAALLLFGQPFGFVALLGVIALAGMIMRNSVILVDQIEQDIALGHLPWNAVIDATVRRSRPILLTAAAAILAMIPLSRSTFWGPMAVAIMGGLAIATLLTILFLPALYAAWFRVRQPSVQEQEAHGAIPVPAE